MGHMTCPRCEESISTVMGPSDHLGYYLSHKELETLESQMGRRYEDIYQWCEDNLRTANHCPYCGYIWEYESDLEPSPGYGLDKPNVVTYKPPPMFAFECQTVGCADKGGYIRRSQAAFDAAKYVCDTCGQPYVKKE